jgi:hypothetical protein
LGAYQNIGNVPDTLMRQGLVVYMGVDLAVGLTRAAKAFVILVNAVNPATGDRYILDLVRGQFPVTKQRELLRMMADRWAPREIVVESNAQQRYFYEGEFVNLPVVPLATGATKHDLIEGIPALIALVQGRKVHIPWKDAFAQSLFGPFVTELVNYPRGETHDILMAWWFTERRIRMALARQIQAEANYNFLRRWKPFIRPRQPRVFGGR